MSVLITFGLDIVEWLRKLDKLARSPQSW